MPLGFLSGIYGASRERQARREAGATYIGGVQRGVLGAQGAALQAESQLAPSRSYYENVLAGRFPSDMPAQTVQEQIRRQDLQGALQFYRNALSGNALINPVVQNYRGALRQAQAQRGTFFGPAGSRDEAQRIGGLQYQQQQQAANVLGQYATQELGARRGMQMQAAGALPGLAGFQSRFEQQMIPGMSDVAIRSMSGGKQTYDQPYLLGRQRAPSGLEAGMAGLLGDIGFGLSGASMLFGGGGMFSAGGAFGSGGFFGAPSTGYDYSSGFAAGRGPAIFSQGLVNPFSSRALSYEK